MLLFELFFKRGVLLLVILSACASLTKQQCLEGNWQQIGIADGVKGYTPARLWIMPRLAVISVSHLTPKLGSGGVWKG